MDLTPANFAGTATQPDNRSAWRDTNPPTSFPVPDGQDHDRMETDDEENDSSSEEEIGNFHQGTGQLVTSENVQTPSVYDEVMDTTPDNPHTESTGPVVASPSGLPEIASGVAEGSSQETTTHLPTNASQTVLQRSNLPANEIGNEWGDWGSSQTGDEQGPPPTTVTTPPAMQDPTATPHTDPPQESSRLENANAAPPQDVVTPPPAVGGEDSSPGQANNEQGNLEQQEGREDNESQDGDSSDEEERAYWAEFVEDTSGPDEHELKAIEEAGREIDALDHGHWESMTFEALEDPEYVAGECGRITWAVTPVNGTPSNPNREKIMRSPSVLIGGLYWNIKYFPRGNDGTEQMSVYIECSSSPPEDTESDEDVSIETSAEQENKPQSSNMAPTEAVDYESDAAAQIIDPTSDNPQPPLVVNDSNPGSGQVTKTLQWEVAAQVGCVVYNPGEPRVNTFRKTSHRFSPDNADWGWTRFHGPWETIHLRQRLERQALLRNDTLAFTAYIRTVKDDTKSLWWHTSKKCSDWDSYARIGVKPLATGLSKDNAIIAALSCWLHLSPIVKLITDMEIPGALAKPGMRKRPLFAALQQLLEYMFSKPEDTDRQSILNCLAWLDWYITETDPPRHDVPEVVAVWETLRRALSYEASEAGDMATASDCFQDVLLLKQPDPWKDESPITFATPGHDLDASTKAHFDEPRSVQETIDLAASSANLFRPWAGLAQPTSVSDKSPSLLQVELHRQKYDKKARHWDKLTHRIELNEKITYTTPQSGNKCDYTLFGMVVHAGALDSQEFYSIIRPQGPGTRWIMYQAGGLQQRGASCLTTAQAVTAHEGKGNSSTGDAAVAYVVLYVRTDSISDILLPPSISCLSLSPVAKTAEGSEDVNNEDNIWLRIYKSTVFEAHVGRGLPDLWDPEISSHDLHLPQSTSLMKVTSHLEHLKLPDHENDTYTILYLDTGLSTARGLPRLIPAEPQHTLRQIADLHNGCRLWVHYQLHDKTEDADTMEVIEAPAESQQAPMDTHGATDEPADTEMMQEQPVEPAAHAEESEILNDTRDGPASPPSQTQTQGGEEVPPSALQEQTDGGTDSEDAEMFELHMANTETGQRQVDTSFRKPRLYIFVKMFDSQAQTLRGVCSSKVLPESDIHDEIGRLLGSEDTLDIYHESSRSIREHDRIRSSRKFNDYDFRDGSIFVAQRRPTPEETTSLKAQGKHPDPMSYFRHLSFNDDPAYLASHEVFSYFGTEYSSGSLSNSLFHGDGTMIYSNGDAYMGNWVSGFRSGHGTMAYTSGDTYIGNWASDKHEGHGKMVYGKTNNVYEGGWKKGRRHGKGVMQYEVADEELAMCKICYESEMDALFYDCGHVVACEECARQVDTCPVCRKSVRGVCRIWRT
ncbi:MAG: hypothetical protein Q9201_000351 [Fulgogasparrea decipioides]